MKVVFKTRNCGKHRLPGNHGFAAVEDKLRFYPLRQDLPEVLPQSLKGEHQFFLPHVDAVFAHLFGEVAVTAVEVAALGRVYIRGGKLQPCAQVIHFRVEFRRAGQKIHGHGAVKSLRQIMAINQSPVGRVCLDNRDPVRVADLQHGKIRAMAGVGENGCCCLFVSLFHYLPPSSVVVPALGASRI